LDCGDDAKSTYHSEPSGTDAGRQCFIVQHARIWGAWDSPAHGRGNASGNFAQALKASLLHRNGILAFRVSEFNYGRISNPLRQPRSCLILPSRVLPQRGERRAYLSSRFLPASGGAVIIRKIGGCPGDGANANRRESGHGFGANELALCFHTQGRAGVAECFAVADK
jgi:hypothetical protein